MNCAIILRKLKLLLFLCIPEIKCVSVKKKKCFLWLKFPTSVILKAVQGLPGLIKSGDFYALTFLDLGMCTNSDLLSFKYK